MKGVVFCELFELVENQFGYELVDRLIDLCELENDGAYTRVGTYSCSELLTIVTALSKETGMPIPDLVKVFGGHLFGKFFADNEETLKSYRNTFDLLVAVEDIIHVEVRKLWDNVELPSFEYERPDSKNLVMTYNSTRPFADLCEGLILACIEHYQESISVRREDLKDDGTRARFFLSLSS